MKARASEVFVGRTGELGELERVLEAARAGMGETVLVAGEAGIGKTRLASEVARRARGAGFEVFVGRSIDLVGTDLIVRVVENPIINQVVFEGNSAIREDRLRDEVSNTPTTMPFAAHRFAKPPGWRV